MDKNTSGNFSGQWASAKTIKDLAEAYSSIYEAKKVDQDEDGDNDFADVRIARMVASGVPKEVAIARVKNKSYNKEEFDIYEETDEERKEKRRARIRELESQGRVMTSSRATSERAKQRKQQKREEELERLANRILSTTTGSTRRSKTPMGSEQPAPKQKAPESNRKLGKDAKSDPLSAKANEILRSIQRENYFIVSSYLLENNFAETIEDASVIIENMSENWIDSILEEKKSLD